MVDGSRDILHIGMQNLEYQGIDLRDYILEGEQNERTREEDHQSNQSNHSRGIIEITSAEGMGRMYKSFFQDIYQCMNGKPQDTSHIGISQALESMLFLSCCVTSNLHFGSWVEMASMDGFRTF